MRTCAGIFDLLAIDPVRYQIYDPLTVRPDPARPGFFIRDPFPGNIIPQSRIINPMYQDYVKFLPKPNSNPTDPGEEPSNNYLRMRTYTDPIQSQIYGARFDYNHSNTHRFFGRWSGSYFTEGLDDWTYQSVGIHSEDMKRTTNAGTGNWTWVKSSSTVVDAQVSANTFHEGGERKTLAAMRSSRRRATGLSRREMRGVRRRADREHARQFVRPSEIEIWPAIRRSATTRPKGTTRRILQFTANMTHVRAIHTLKFGTDMRRHSRTGFLPGASQGVHVRPDLHAPVSDTALVHAREPGLSWAAFMLGIPTASTLNTPVDYATSSPYYSAFAQEAWRATSKLTVNLGLRFEVEQGMTETADRMITGFDPDFVPAFANEVVAAYARTRFLKCRWRRSATT